MALFTFTNVTVFLVSVLVARRVYWEATTGARHRAIAKQHGCLPPRSLNTPWSGLVLGLDLLRKNIRAFQEHRMLEAWTSSLRDNDVHTIRMEVLGQEIYLTDDPENTKTVLATDFDAWSLGEDRIKQMSSFLGHGIFTTEGAAWKHSRDMLRPCFERSQVADVSMLEKHTSRLIDILPRDGTTVDLQLLLHDLTLDVASEFLFDQSTDVLLGGERKEEILREFVKPFNYCTNPLESKNNKWGILAMFLPDPEFKRSARQLQGMYLIRPFLSFGLR
jgi:cytochrome P450